MSDFQPTAKVKGLDQKHPDYAAMESTWADVDLLYAGGQKLRDNASRFLRRRPKELAEVYSKRLEMVSYQNILGTALGWYESALFADRPEIEGADGDFYTGFLADCDHSGTSFADFTRSVFRHLTQFQKAYILVDIPRLAERPATLAEQEAVGGLSPHLVLYSPRHVINWRCDEHGNMEWVVLSVKTTDTAFMKEPEDVERWYYFDRESYATYERRGGMKDDEATLISDGPHATPGRVPLRCVSIPDSLWLANRVRDQVVDHLNQRNNLAWALMMSALAMPVLITDDDLATLTLSEAGYLKLGLGSSIEWTEPEGRSLAVLAQNIRELLEEIYRQMYLQAQGRSSEATPAAQSGYSKELDMAPANDVLCAFGDKLREAMRMLLDDVAEIRGEERDFRVLGFDVNRDLGVAEIDAAERARNFGVPGETFARWNQKRVAKARVGDSDPELLQTIFEEIDATPVVDEAAARAERLRESMAGAFNSE